VRAVPAAAQDVRAFPGKSAIKWGLVTGVQFRKGPSLDSDDS
jgi:hypothetical protein